MRKSLMFLFLIGWFAGNAQIPFTPQYDDCDYGFSSILDIYGDDIAISGVSLPEGHHIVYMFSKASGNIEQVAVFNPDAVAYTGFGQKMSLGENTIAIGAQYQENGAVYMYRKIAGNWQPTQQLMPADLTPDSSFGNLIKISGKYLFIAAYGDRPQGNQSPTQGSVYVYVFNGSQWVFSQKLFIPGVSYFGIDLDAKGLMLVVRSYDGVFNALHTYMLDEDVWVYDGTTENAGGTPRLFEDDKLMDGAFEFAYVNHLWTATGAQVIVPMSEEGIGEFDGFSWSAVAPVGNDLFMGANSYFLPGPKKFPLLHYKKIDNTWTFLNAIYSPLPLTTADQFGGLLKSYGNTLLIGAQNEGNQTPEPHGIAYLLDASTLGVNAPQDYDVSVYPNPVNRDLFLNKSENTIIASLSIYSVTGCLVAIEKGDLNKISMEQLASGTYFLKAAFEDGRSKTLRIIKR